MTIGDEIGKDLNPELRNQLLEGVIRLELLLPQANEAHLETERKAVLEHLQNHYQVLNQTLAEIVAALNYPRQQNQWKDSQPLEEMLKILPGIQETNWWAMQMEAVMGGY